MGAGNPKFIPVVTDLTTVSDTLLYRVTDALSSAFAEETVTDRFFVFKNKIMCEFARVLAQRGMKNETLRILRLLAENEYPYHKQITSDKAFVALQTDSAFVGIVEQMVKNADFEAMIRRSPAYDTGAMFRMANYPRLSYASSNDSLLLCIRDYFKADYIPGTGVEIERLKNVMFWVHDHVKHCGNFIPNTRYTAIDLYEGFSTGGERWYECPWTSHIACGTIPVARLAFTFYNL